MADFSAMMSIMGNVMSSVGIVIMNKYVVEIDDFHCMVFLSFCHFTFTYLSCVVLSFIGYFEYQDAPIRMVLPVALGSLSSTAFMNLNLAHNSVGFYQLSKLACIPCTIFLDWAFRGKRVSLPIALTLVVITVGVGLATVDDVRVNVLGAVYGAVAILFASLSPILTSSYQRQLTCSSIQLLRLTSPIIASGTLLMIPLFDNIHTLRRMEPSPDLVAHVLISCGMALAVNLTNYLVLSVASPLTYQILSHVKTIAVLSLGFAIFGYQVTMQGVIGILLALVGVMAYGELKRREAAEAVPQAVITQLTNEREKSPA